MTIKYRDKNVSAENKNWILTTPVTLDSNGILTIAKENFYNDETGEVTLNLFDLGVQLIVLEDDNEKTALQKLNEKAQSNDPNIVKERKSHGYLIEHPDSTEQDKWYSEYFWIESKQKFEALGSTKADLNPLKNEINDLKNRATILEGKTTNLENNKVDKETGKGLSEANYTLVEKTKLSNIENNANNTIIVNDLSTGGSSSALSAEQGKLLRLMNGDPMVLEVQGNSFEEHNSSTALQGSNIVVDYGDGTIEPLGTNLEHNYTDGKNNHTVKIYGVTSFGVSCFANCPYLTSVIIPNSITSLGEGCFYNTGLTSISLPNNVTSLGEDCFGMCTGLTSIIIPDSVTSIGSNCFNGCTNLTNYYLNWINPPITWTSDKMPNYTNTIFHIPYGTTALYEAKGFPSNKLQEEVYVRTSEETTDSITNNDLRPVTSNAVNDALSTKASTATASSSTNGLMSSTDKSKLDDMTTVALEVTYADDSPSETLYLVKRSGGS